MAVVPIEIRGLIKDFHSGWKGVKVRAVDHLDLTMPAGSIYGLLGPNGSGKSTTIKVLLGLLQATCGQCRVFDLPAGSIAARRKIGYLPESPVFYRHLSGRELLQLGGRLCGMSLSQLGPRIVELAEFVHLNAAIDRRLATYSKGMLQRIGIAHALIAKPDLLILDEPASGLDPLGTEALKQIIRDIAATGTSILITSHLLGEVQSLCDRIAILYQGKLIAEGHLDDLLGKPNRTLMEVSGLDEAKLAEISSLIAERGGRIEHRQQATVSLQSFFLQQVKKESGK